MKTKHRRRDTDIPEYLPCLVYSGTAIAVLLCFLVIVTSWG